MTDNINNVLAAYNIHPLKINQVTSQLYYIKDYNKEYALKRSGLTEDMVKQWETIYRYSNTQNLDMVLPVYLTKEGNLYYRHEQSIFYLSPWINDTNRERDTNWVSSFYESLAKLHWKTKRIQKIDIETVSNPFFSFQNYCREMRKQLLTFIHQFEKKQYMSPFELLVCTHFRDIEYAFVEVDKRINRFINDHEEDELTWSSSLCHHRLDHSHIKKSYFINWESARFDHPVMDLILFFQNEIGSFNPSTELYIDNFSSYTDINELTLPELQFLSIYLLSPTNYIQSINDYVSGVRSLSMIQHVTNIQHEYRKIIFGLQWSAFIEKEYETLDLDDLEV
ncbi:hypothetical protein [Oceanobacillus caeni]|uniref:hypothetical protein n=1 Tax=Oceanobacillus caeni TaxID=405946 RepID=UPI001C217354|nr:hypothetical protein [Oceanobacillus caeni]MBU8789556.1 hypothetical protein [Oceanobacillus caeni]MED4474249.1 hypothetical protein [Oceanobacillus caeni]